MQNNTTSRREFVALLSAAGVSGFGPARAFAQQQMPTRVIPATGERLPVVGLGSSKVVQQVETEGSEPLAAVLRTLVEHGGRVVDTWPRNADNDAAFGRVINEPDLRDNLFVTTKIDQIGKDVGIAQFRRTQQLYQRETFDLTQIFSLTDLDVHWPSLKDWKEEGATRYIGVTVAQFDLYEQLEEFLGRETPDFIQVNYSITERLAEERLLPMAQDLGIAVVINRPFMNGAYFGRLEGQALPEWTAEFDCTSWAQFSLKYILANPAITCVLTETSNPVHMAENASTAFGPVPDAQARARMREFIENV
ncbi:aldo/keto reductase [Candidatus Rariloculus sp.]|uniref:aldo/keto reductase n=1 Tax=Candidatus Rariloculus sp. TaxID=3101265 RepID=UPI003D14C65C